MQELIIKGLVLDLFRTICAIVFTTAVLILIGISGYSIYSEAVQKEITKKLLKLPEGYEIEHSKQINKYRWVFNDGTNKIYGVTQAETREDAVENAVNNKIERAKANPVWEKEQFKVEKF